MRLQYRCRVYALAAKFKPSSFTNTMMRIIAAFAGSRAIGRPFAAAPALAFGSRAASVDLKADLE